MARCCGGTECACIVVEGDGIEVTGQGTVDDPYVVTRLNEAIAAENVTYDGGPTISATDVEGALDELGSEKAPLVSPALTGTPTAPTAAPGTNTTQLATTAYADSAASSAASLALAPSIVNGDTTHAPNGNAVFDALATKAPLASPVFTGNPTAPTPALTDNDTTIATTAFVHAQTITATAVLDFPNVVAQTAQTLTVTVTGAAVGDSVALGPPAAFNAGLVATGWVSAVNTVSIQLANVTVADINPASATWRATVFKTA